MFVEGVLLGGQGLAGGDGEEFEEENEGVLAGTDATEQEEEVLVLLVVLGGFGCLPNHLNDNRTGGIPQPKRHSSR